MGDNCIFCKIVSGGIPAKKIFEDKSTLAFLDINPASQGHSLVIPKKHYPTMEEIPEEELKEVIVAVKKVGSAVMKATEADGFNVMQNNGEAAGQIVHHLHFHIVPRKKGDSLRLAFGGKEAKEEELEEWAEKIKKQI